MLPPFCRTHGDHDDKASGLTIVERKSTDLSFGAAISNYSRPARGVVLSEAYSICFELWGTRVVRCSWTQTGGYPRSEEHTSELQSLTNLVCRLLLEKKKKKNKIQHH